MNALSRHRRRHPEDPGGHGGPSPVLDPAALARLQQLDPDGRRGFMAQVLRTYDTSLLRYLDALTAARQAGDLRQAAEAAHTLKSSSAALGAARLAAHCAEVERLARDGDAGALGEPFGQLLEEAVRVQAAVRAMLPI